MQVEKQLAHFYEVTISEEEANAGIVVRVTSQAQSKFKVNLLCAVRSTENCLSSDDVLTELSCSSYCILQKKTLVDLVWHCR